VPKNQRAFAQGITQSVIPVFQQICRLLPGQGWPMRRAGGLHPSVDIRSGGNKSLHFAAWNVPWAFHQSVESC